MILCCVWTLFWPAISLRTVNYLLHTSLILTNNNSISDLGAYGTTSVILPVITKQWLIHGR